MIKFNNLSNDLPYLAFKIMYDKSLKAKQKKIEAVCISSYSKKFDEVNSRFVNLKFINDKEFIFFSNYESPKSQEFKSHSQITAVFYWNSINVQIRMKALIQQTSTKFNSEYFLHRDQKKNALAISSDQSTPIRSYKDVERKYLNSLKLDNLRKCPSQWGGYAFIPYYFEFWEGHELRLNKREVYEKSDDDWNYFILQP
ncbi:pyridoxamine 5'-phosphate oxidase family protein [Gammaproteobacteria bacterium]|nr:pyridoxamine 5'-phosphate oxidase family protein [Gammaproteobacteria bacterium]